MIGIIVAGHGNFASGITTMLELVVGKPEHYEFIDFLLGESQEALEEDYRDKLDKLKDCEKIVIMTDITGGSPFKSAVTYAVSDDRLNVISGTNVPMLVELIFGRMNSDDSEALIQSAMEAGKAQIIRFHKDML
ncbi:MAG: PTS sugar transporter subunit IIA [Clostridiales bacterium]|nr:PTS sugar transporter subunit IIA [Clostridiales bacterium]